jgi:hypothetical protein
LAELLGFSTRITHSIKASSILGEESNGTSTTLYFLIPLLIPDIGDYFTRLPSDAYSPTWYKARINGNLGAEEKQYAQNTALHSNTPKVIHAHVLGREFLFISQNAFKYSDALPSDPITVEDYAMRVNMDIQGNDRRTYDSKVRLVSLNNFRMLGQLVYHTAMDAGQQWGLWDIGGNTKYLWDDRGYRFQLVFDTLKRPTEAYRMYNNHEFFMSG